MNDIVERLRAVAGPWQAGQTMTLSFDLLLEAAEEIERLRAELQAIEHP